MNRKFWVNFDWISLFVAFFLTLFGIISLISTTFNEANLLTATVRNQIIFVFIGLILVFIIAYFEYRTLQSYAVIIFGISVTFLILVLFFGEIRNNIKAWFDLGFFDIQPSEPAKMAFVVALAYYFAKNSIHTLKNVFSSMIFLLIPIVLILFQPDLGTAIAYVVIWVVMILTLNIPKKKLVLLIMSAMGSLIFMLVLILNFMPKDNFQYQRLLVYPDHLFLKDVRHMEIGYQVDQSLIAIGAGQIKGKGVSQGSQSQLGFLPAAKTDFIFANIAEEMGFWAVGLILALITIFLYRILRIANLAQDRFGRFIAIGIFGFFFYHFIQNIAMNIGLLPVTGIPLTFVSYGGSHLMTAFIALGLLESIVLRYKKIKY